MSSKLLLSPFARLRGRVDVRTLILVADQEPLLGHNLHELKNRAVLSCAAAADHVIHLAHGCWPNTPKHGKDFKFGIRRTWRHAFHKYENITSKSFVCQIAF